MNYQLKNNPDIERVFSKIDEVLKKMKRPVLVAIDGRSGTGKTTIAKKIADRFRGVEINADDFWVGGSNDEWGKRSPKEKAEMAIDWKRIKTEVLEPLLAGKSAAWHLFDWKAGHGLSESIHQSKPKPLIVFDGAYSTRPEMLDIIDLSILVEVPHDANRRARLIKREGEAYMKDWHDRWDIAEDYYFTKIRPSKSFNFIIENN